MSDFHLTEELFNELLDETLPQENVLALEAHLAVCAECSARLDQIARLFSDLENLPELQMNRDLSGFVVQAIRPNLEIPRQWKWAILTQFALAGLILMFTIPALLTSDVVNAMGLFWTSEIINNPIRLDFVFQIELYILNLMQFISFEVQNFQIPDLPLTLVTVLPILMTSGILWLVGNGLLLRKRIDFN